MRNKNYRNIRSALRIPSVRGYEGCAFDGGVCRRHPVVRHGDGVVLRFSYESVFVYPITKKTRPYRGEAEIGRGEGRPSASQARNRAPIFRERLLEEALRDETAKCFINIKKERCTERVIDDRTTTIREAICIGSQYSSSTAHSCVNK